MSQQCHLDPHHHPFPPSPPPFPPAPPLPTPKRVKNTTKTGSASSSPTGKHPTYRGIRSRGGKWVSEIREPKKATRIWLGTYPSPEMAAAAYDVAALAIKRGGVALNFPSRADSFPVPTSSSPEDVRRAASAAAELMRADEAGTAWRSDSEAVGTYEYVDEEELFYMPNLLVDMAEGMLVSPPRIAAPPSEEWPETFDCGSLWNYY